MGHCNHYQGKLLKVGLLEPYTTQLQIGSTDEYVEFDFAAPVKVHEHGSASFRKGVVIGQKNSTNLFFLSLKMAKKAVLLNSEGKQGM